MSVCLKEERAFGCFLKNMHAMHFQATNMTVKDWVQQCHPDIWCLHNKRCAYQVSCISDKTLLKVNIKKWHPNPPPPLASPVSDLTDLLDCGQPWPWPARGRWSSAGAPPQSWPSGGTSAPHHWRLWSCRSPPQQCWPWPGLWYHGMCGPSLLVSCGARQTDKKQWSWNIKSKVNCWRKECRTQSFTTALFSTGIHRGQTKVAQLRTALNYADDWALNRCIESKIKCQLRGATDLNSILTLNQPIREP